MGINAPERGPLILGDRASGRCPCARASVGRWPLCALREETRSPTGTCGPPSGALTVFSGVAHLRPWPLMPTKERLQPVQPRVLLPLSLQDSGPVSQAGIRPLFDGTRSESFLKVIWNLGLGSPRPRLPQYRDRDSKTQPSMLLTTPGLPKLPFLRSP